ncbi:TonB-dependent receptor domain-containing protein [Flagellimonas sp.]|uniref:TonB-dependent receptor domain-containing protein n=1 Tax=Flagellimonas sp. TaxID=2058762 RepID=UPI003AB53832
MIRTITLLLFLTTSLLYANAKITVTGKILQMGTNTPLEYATVSFTETGRPNPIYGGITDENGFFSIEVEKGTYTIKIEYLGFKPLTLDNKKIGDNLDLGILLLSEDAQSLSEVVVKGEKGLFENKLDKKIYNIDRDLTAQSTNVLQALNNVPSVSVSVDGGIALRGNSNVRILVNGKPSGLVGISDAQGLERLSSNAVERIEIITNPSARYDAEGAAGIINIILKKGRNLGFNGSVQAVLGVPETFGVGGNLNYRTTKFNVFANLNFEDAKRPGHESVNTTFLDETTGTTTDFLSQRQDITRDGSEYTMALGIDYYFNEKNTLTFMGLYANEDNDNNGLSIFNTFDVDGTLISTRLRGQRELEEDSSDEYTLTYKSIFDEDEEHVLMVEAKYDSNTEIESATFEDTYSVGNFEDAQDRTAAEERQRNLLIQADYVFPFSETGSFEAGYRSTMRTIKFNSIVENFNSDTNIWELDGNLSNRMDYGEDIYAAYLQYANAFGKFTLLTGLRMEITHIDVTQFTSDISLSKNYGNLFPSFHLGYQLTETSELKTSYGRRINRPSFRELNPFSGYSNDLNLLSGNPNLDPVFTNSLELGYTRNWDGVSLETIGYFQYSKDIVQLITTNSGMVNEESIPILITRPLNVGTENRYGLEVSSIYSPSNWLRVNGTINWFRFEQNASFDNTVPDPGDSNALITERQSLNTNSSSWFARLSPKISLPREIDVQMGIQYDAPFREAYTTRRGMLVANVSVNKELFKGRGAINLNISDLFNSRISRREASNTSFLSNSESQYVERQFNLTFTYRFKNTEEHRDDGDDEDYEDDDYDES